jgi:hypothetical protein
LGTFNASQFKRLQTFAQAQLADIPGRLAHLAAEQARVGNVLFQFNQSVVVSYAVSDPDSYIGRLFAVYEILGGDAFYDLPLRQSQTQALFLMKGDESHSAQLISNGKVVGTQGLMDADSAIPVQQIRAWMNDSIQYKREAIERKIRRALDYADQLAAEAQLLNTIQGDATTTGSLANLIAAINALITSQNYRAIADDKGQDPTGNYAYAPYIGLEPGPARTVVDGFYRAFQGYVTPNDGLDSQ